MMTADSDTVAASKDHLQAKATDDSSRFEYFEVVPLAADADGSCTTECVSEDWSAEVKQEDMAGVKEEPVDVCCIIFGTFGLLLQKQFIHLLGVFWLCLMPNTLLSPQCITFQFH